MHEQLEFLNKILNYPEKADIIYRASSNQFSASAFHKKCDNVTDTLVLVRTEFGKTIGGFTHYPWDSEGKDVQDSQRRAFLFSLDMKEKFVPNSDSLIVNKSHRGPIFGFKMGTDLCIADQCNNNDDSYSCFPADYNREEVTGRKLL